MLQQLLPFTVLKLIGTVPSDIELSTVATALTVYGIETFCLKILNKQEESCNSSYRLRY